MMTRDDVRAARKELNWSRTRFAQHVGVTLRTVERWESGRFPPSPIAERTIGLLLERKRVSCVNAPSGVV